METNTKESQLLLLDVHDNDIPISEVGDFETERKKNILQNYEFMKACGKCLLFIYANLFQFYFLFDFLNKNKICLMMREVFSIQSLNNLRTYYQPFQF